MRRRPPLPAPNCVTVGLANVPVPVTAAVTSWMLAPKPVTLAACGGPATGLAENAAGLSSSEPGMLELSASGFGNFGRLARYSIWVVACAGKTSFWDCSSWGPLPTRQPREGPNGAPSGKQPAPRIRQAREEL